MSFVYGSIQITEHSCYNEHPSSLLLKWQIFFLNISLLRCPFLTFAFIERLTFANFKLKNY